MRLSHVVSVVVLAWCLAVGASAQKLSDERVVFQVRGHSSLPSHTHARTCRVVRITITPSSSPTPPYKPSTSNSNVTHNQQQTTKGDIELAFYPEVAPQTVGLSLPGGCQIGYMDRTG
jgi:hypothetical protein